MTGRTDVWGLRVTNLRTDEELHTTQRRGSWPRGYDPADAPDAPIQFVATFTLTEGWDPLAYPGPTVPPTATFTLHIDTNRAEVPDWRPGDTLNIELVSQPVIDWWTLDYSELPPDFMWIRRHLLIDSLEAAPTRTGIALAVTCTGPWAGIAGTPITAAFDRPKEGAFTRLNEAIRDDIPATIGGTILDDSDFLGATHSLGPANISGAPLGDVLTEILAGGDDLGPDVEARIAHPDIRYSITSAKWLLLENRLDHRSATQVTPYRLELVGSMAVAVTRDPSEYQGANSDGVVLDACYLPRDQVTWTLARQVNTVRLGTIDDTGSPRAVTVSHPAQVDANGALVREVTTQNANDAAINPATALAYLGDEAAATTTWRPSLLTLGTEQIPPDQIDYYTRVGPVDEGGGLPSGTPLQAAVVNVADAWELGDDTAGLVTSYTYTITDGRLDILLTITPRTYAPDISSDPLTTASYQDLLDDFDLAPVAYTDAGATWIDPDITYANMRLIGV